MRKFKIITVVSLMVIISAATFSSCKKDGVYKPKKKVSKIYEQNLNGEKKLSETWIWDNDKLSRIDYENGDFDVFEYEKDRLITVTEKDGNYQKYIYSGSKIDEIQYWYKNDDVMYVMYKFEYKGNKLSQITLGYGGILLNDLKGMETSIKNQKSNALRYILPEQIAGIVSIPFEKQLKSRKALEPLSIMKIIWKGNNIEQVTFGNKNIEVGAISKYTYDNKLNPMYGLLIEESVISSKNNIKKFTLTNSYGLGDTIEQEYSYMYDGDFPTEVTIKQTIGNIKSTSIIYYEYK